MYIMVHVVQDNSPATSTVRAHSDNGQSAADYPLLTLVNNIFAGETSAGIDVLQTTDLSGVYHCRSITGGKTKDIGQRFYRIQVFVITYT